MRSRREADRSPAKISNAWSYTTCLTRLRGAHKDSCVLNLLTPYRGRTAPLTSKSCILYIYSTNISTEYFKHGIYSPFFSLQNAVCFIILTYLVPVLFTFYIQDLLKLKKNNSGAKRLIIIVARNTTYSELLRVSSSGP